MPVVSSGRLRPSIRRKVVPLLAALAASALVFSACSGDDDESTPASPTAVPVEQVTFMAGFKPQANLPFVGAYIAQEKGYFSDENLDVDIKHVTTPGDNFKFLATGEVQFSTADAATLLEKRAGHPPLDFVSIALIGRRGERGFAVLTDPGIARGLAASAVE